jgi:hypothetical protein
MKIELKKGRVVKMFSKRVEAEKIFEKMDFESIKDFDDIGFYVLPRETEVYYDIRKANEYIKENHIENGLSEKELEMFKVK